MTPKQLHDLFRTQIADTIEPFLFSKQEIYEYMTDAQRMLCRLTEGIPEATDCDITKICFGPNEQFGKMSDLILTVRGASRASDGKEIEVLNIEDFRFGTGALSMDTSFDYGFMYGANVYHANTDTWRTKTGPKIRAIILGMERNKARAYPVPDVADDINLEVYRLPKIALSDSGDSKFEVDDQHHRHLLMWMKSLAYSKQDVDIRDETLSAAWEEKFIAYCEKARREQGRAKHKPRTVLYGGI